MPHAVQFQSSRIEWSDQEWTRRGWDSGAAGVADGGARPGRARPAVRTTRADFARGIFAGSARGSRLRTRRRSAAFTPLTCTFTCGRDRRRSDDLALFRLLRSNARAVCRGSSRPKGAGQDGYQLTRRCPRLAPTGRLVPVLMARMWHAEPSGRFRLAPWTLLRRPPGRPGSKGRTGWGEGVSCGCFRARRCGRRRRRRSQPTAGP